MCVRLCDHKAPFFVERGGRPASRETPSASRRGTANVPNSQIERGGGTDGHPDRSDGVPGVQTTMSTLELH